MLPSLVSFNTTIPRTQSYIVSSFGFIFNTAYNYIIFCCLRGNVEASCHKQDSLMRGAASSSVSRDQQTLPLSAITYRLTRRNLDSAIVTMDPAVIDAKARYWSKIAIFAPVRGGGPRWHSSRIRDFLF